MSTKSRQGQLGLIKKSIEIRNSPGRGRGVFATGTIRAGVLIEACPALVFLEKDWEAVEKSPFGPYVFDWRKRGALALGIISLINHSDEPNIEIVSSFKNQQLLAWTLREIKKGEELSFDYGDTYKADWKKN